MKLKKKLLSIAFSFSILLSTFGSDSYAASNQTMRVEFIDVGAGDSIYIEMPNGDDVLIDAGVPSKGDDVVNYLNKLEKNMTLEYLISTHSDADHVGGMSHVFKKMKVKNFYYPTDVSYSTKTAKNVIALAKKEKGCKIRNAKTGTLIKGGGAKLEFVHSKTNYKSDNEDSTMIYVDYGNLEMLLTGDAEYGSEAAAKKYNVDIVQVPHHGSKNSSSSSFIKRFDPEKIIISTNGKSYGHPHKETINRYKSYDKNIDVYRTDRNGNIKVFANGKKWYIKTQKSSSQKITNTKPGSSSSNSGSGSTSTSKYVYVNGGSSSSNKYHKTATAHNMKGGIKMTEKQAKSKGYVACKTCF